MLKIFYSILIASLLVSVVQAEEQGISLSLSAGTTEKSIRISGAFNQEHKGMLYSLKVTGFGEVSIKEKFKTVLQENPEFEVILNPLFSYDFQIIEYDRYGGEVSVTEIAQKITLSRFKVNKKPNTNLLLRKNTLQKKSQELAASTSLTANIKNVSCEAFPSVSIDTEIKRDGVTVLNASNFSILENGLAPSSSINILPPKSGESKRAADFVFIFDHSGSMDDDLKRLQASITDFVNELKNTNIEYNLAFVPYEQNPRIEQAFTSDADVFLQSIQNFLDNWPGGGTENAFKALETSITSLAWTPSAQKVLILFTDEDDDHGGPSLTSINNTLTSASATVYGVVRKNSGYSNTHFCAAGSVTNVTGGRCYDIGIPDFKDILNDITATVGGSYLISYDSSDTNSSNEVRTIELNASEGGETVSSTIAYNFSQCGNQLDISLDEDTLSLGETGHRQHQAIEIKAFIKSIDSTLPITANVYYRVAGNGESYQSVSMQFAGNDVYRGIIPKNTIIAPGVEYYIQVSNTKKTMTLPTTRADDNPLSFGVLPNKLPKIIHTPVSSVAINKDITITAEASDNTNKLQSVKLFYKNEGLLYTYKSVEMTNISGDVYQAIIPASEISGNQINYYIQAVDDFNMPNFSGIPLIAPHQVIISRGIYGSECAVVNLTIKVCGDSKKEVGNISTISGNVTIGHADDDTPMIGVETAIEVNLSNKTFNSIGVGRVTALQFKRNVNSDPEDFLLFEGGFDGDAVGTNGSDTKPILVPKNLVRGEDSHFRIFNISVPMTWSITGAGGILIDSGKLELQGLVFSIVNYIKSGLTDVLKIDAIVVDQKGKDTTGGVELNLSKSGELFGLNPVLGVEDALLKIDFIRASVNIGGTFHLGKLGKLPVNGKQGFIKEVIVNVGFIIKPFAFDSLFLNATINNEPDFFAVVPYSFPKTPPSSFGIAPYGFGVSMEKIAGGLSAGKYGLTLQGAIVDVSFSNQVLKKSTGKWPFLLSATGLVEPSTGSWELLGDIKLLEEHEFGSANIKYSGAQGTSFSAKASVYLPKKEAAFIRGVIAMNLSSNRTGNIGLVAVNGGLDVSITIPSDLSYIGGMNLGNVGLGFDYLSKSTFVNDIADKSNIEKFIASGFFKVLWADFRLTYDFRKNEFSANKSKFLQADANNQLAIGGYNKGSIASISSNSSYKGDSGLTIEITDSSNVVLIKINSTQSAAIFDLETPDGTLYKIEDATADSNALLADTAFFLTNENANEGYWALKQPVLGTYKLKIRNTADLGDYQIATLYQNIKPTIALKTQLTDINVQAGDKVKITWVATDPDDNADISLYYSTDKQRHDGKIIMAALSEDSDSEFEWTIPEGIYGAYYIYAVIDDGNLGRITEYSQGRIIFPDSPAPSAPQGVVATVDDGTASLLWTANNSSEQVTAYRVNIRESGQTNTNKLVVYTENYTFKNLGNGMTYEMAVNAINSNGFVSEPSSWVSVTPQGLSQDGPPDLLIPQENILATLDGASVNLRINVENVTDYQAYSYQLSCWVGTQDSEHLIGEIKGTTLAGKSVITHQLQFNALTFPKPIGEMLICKISDVSIEELNTANNSIVNTQALKGLLNNVPVAVEDTATTAKDTILVINVLSNDTDPDGDTLSIQSVETVSTQGVTVVNNGDGTFTYTPASGFIGTDTFTYTISDGNGGENSGVVTITVTNTALVNNAPSAVNDIFSTTENSVLATGNVLLNDTDPDGDTLSIQSVDSTSIQNGTVVNNGDGTFTYTPASDFIGTDTFTYTISDGNGGENSGVVTITVTNTTLVNNALLAVNDTFSTTENSVLTTGNVLLNDTGSDGDTLSIQSVETTSTQGGTVVNNGDGTFTYAPASGFTGTDTFTYILSDGNGNTANGLVEVIVNKNKGGGGSLDWLLILLLPLVLVRRIDGL